ncbi:hypothetical protein CK203_083359 [Vitis vinifera]|uniref:Uncharacterized protein n=1 Tax=Vitis vinifera TaxID=29760 RepID=A0A438BVY8_VITVI|nr:hypothetical protein CK203_083359 [Vitis vinifera]
MKRLVEEVTRLGGDVSSRAEKRVGKEVENGSGRELGNRSHGPVIWEWALTNGRASRSSPLDPIVGLKELKRASGPAVANGYLAQNQKKRQRRMMDQKQAHRQGDRLQNWATTR